MQIKKLITSISLGLLTVFTTANAQDILPEAINSRPTSEKCVKAIPTVPTFAELDKAAEAAIGAYMSDSKFGEGIVDIAMKYIGTRYSYGSKGPKAFDCSGFTSFIYGQKDVAITRSSRSQYTQGAPIAKISELKKGDLVFFGGRRNRRSVGHVGIVTDVDKSGKAFSFVHASNTGVKVSASNEDYYSRRYIGARRIIQ